MKDGVYSGYIQNGNRHGPGTLVDKKFKWRMEGTWCDNKAFIGKGQKEFNDGEVQFGKFVCGVYKPEVSSLIENTLGHSPSTSLHL